MQNGAERGHRCDLHCAFQVFPGQETVGLHQTLKQRFDRVHSTNTAGTCTLTCTLRVYMVSQSAANILLWRILPVLQLIEASIGGSPDTGTLLSPLPFHKFIINQGFLGKFGGIQQLYYFVNYFLKGEKETKRNKLITFNQ